MGQEREAHRNDDNRERMYHVSKFQLFFIKPLISFCFIRCAIMYIRLMFTWNLEFQFFLFNVMTAVQCTMSRLALQANALLLSHLTYNKLCCASRVTGGLTIAHLVCWSGSELLIKKIFFLKPRPPYRGASKARVNGGFCKAPILYFEQVESAMRGACSARRCLANTNSSYLPASNPSS